MADRDHNIIHSGLSGHKTIDSHSFKLCIYRLENTPEWALEIELSDGGSVVWDGTFESDDAAYAEFERTLRDEGLGAVLGTDAVVVPFPKR